MTTAAFAPATHPITTRAVRSEDRLPADLHSSIASAYRTLANERALAYRRQRGLTLEGVRLAVLIQHLVVADVSAVVFGANPVDGNRAEVLVNASWGLDESIVGGTVTPDTYRARKSDHAILARHVGDKQRMTVTIVPAAMPTDHGPFT